MTIKEDKIKVSGMTCTSCERVIKNAMSKEQGITSTDVNVETGFITVNHYPDIIPLERIEQIINEKGYKVIDANVQLLPQKIAKKTKHSNTKQEVSSSPKHYIEKLMLKNAFIAIIVLFILQLITNLSLFSSVENFWSKYGVYFVYLIIAIVANATAIWHIRCYQESADCMSGMMIGMTLGMMSGFMGGAIIGATNGMFMGSIYGMLVGMGVGAWCGKSCGIMGIMEGLMAGLMAGTMGAMLSVMMVFDHLQLFLAFLFIVCLSILGGLGYMVHEKNSESAPRKKNHTVYDTAIFIFVCYFITLITTFIIIYGPRAK